MYYIKAFLFVNALMYVGKSFLFHIDRMAAIIAEER